MCVMCTCTASCQAPFYGTSRQLITDPTPSKKNDENGGDVPDHLCGYQRRKKKIRNEVCCCLFRGLPENLMLLRFRHRSIKNQIRSSNCSRSNNYGQLHTTLSSCDKIAPAAPRPLFTAFLRSRILRYEAIHLLSSALVLGD